MFLGSCRQKSWARVVQDSILLMNTFLILFGSFSGGYTGPIVPYGLCEERSSKQPSPNGCQKPWQDCWVEFAWPIGAG